MSEAGDLNTSKVVKSEAEWRTQLTQEEFDVTRRAGTERPFTGIYWNEERDGFYHCKCCDNPLFESMTKFDAGCGWPSFYAPLNREALTTREDNSLGMRRIEVLCARCDAHLGHVFPDGPEPTGLRFCMNSVSLNFYEEAE
ncbi:MAG TPA: peptide-methionine (R)-S-oxide reductase [Gammaproteobacteria bacterium]|nr:peptide-methionine (R)-S-oxide reductase [Gammaproteobacteria bacterium]|tara:strand:+ start:667 stop:1089 length:423 start_codon:yes stop_codon:yes gene_type:complete